MKLKIALLQIAPDKSLEQNKLNGIADICIKSRETETFKIQELHLPIYHYICAVIEEHFSKQL